jgi:hypothetical protein
MHARGPSRAPSLRALPRGVPAGRGHTARRREEGAARAPVQTQGAGRSSTPAIAGRLTRPLRTRLTVDRIDARIGRRRPLWNATKTGPMRTWGFGFVHSSSSAERGDVSPGVRSPTTVSGASGKVGQGNSYRVQRSSLTSSRGRGRRISLRRRQSGRAHALARRMLPSTASSELQGGTRP